MAKPSQIIYMKRQTVSLAFMLLILGAANNFVFGLELGVGTHFGQGRGDPAFAFKWMKSAGMNSFRDEIYWSNVEFQSDKFAPDAKAQLSLKAFSEAKSQGINPILILSYGNPIYDGGTQPYSEKGRAAFAAYAAWLCKQLKDKVEYFEVWNEWNLGAGTFPKKMAVLRITSN
jgi:polysaccharide biosynthesis protein PslG